MVLCRSAVIYDGAVKIGLCFVAADCSTPKLGYVEIKPDHFAVSMSTGELS